MAEGEICMCMDAYNIHYAQYWCKERKIYNQSMKLLKWDH